MPFSPNVLLEFQEPEAVNELWVGDISYTPLVGNKLANLAMLMDCYSRLIVDWKLSTDMTESLVNAALRSAIVQRQPAQDLIHHTDCGGQYADPDSPAKTNLVNEIGDINVRV
jgi:transposase InsO family protein